MIPPATSHSPNELEAYQKEFRARMSLPTSRVLVSTQPGVQALANYSKIEVLLYFQIIFFTLDSR